ncbi:two-component sensor histidine kinase [Streptomyces lunaelactis]|uniref:histidine kinase n=1 Tax=Streptomyces lunaelactis TaxID=1535768 RepID=A0A2R4TCL4_9ACTN|nr:HAMP domain-containing sensor histidine kinase [Streptomyces lunaelactis]AVZ76831.1 two-component sensor histidine kinase [Streptomyces lunaelactis]NUK88919.1 HAMP domain-containing histidine kinase [Streptomyces lunaelactis]
MPLRWRIAALVAVAICAVAAAVGVLVHHASRDRELSQARDSARTTLDRAAVTYARTGAVQGTGAALDAPDVPDGLQGIVKKGRWGTEFTAGPDGPAMWAARPAGKRVLSVRVDMTTTMRDISALDTSIAWAGVITTAVVLPLGVLTAGRMSRRLRTAAGTARRIAAGDLDARIRTASRPRDEIAEISAAVDTMAGALQERLRGEQRFTADVAHELRTPLMGLVTAAELLPDGEAAGYVRDRVRVLAALVEELLEISRLDAGAEQADLSPCPIVSLVEEIVTRAGLSVQLTAAEPPTAGRAAVWTDPRRVERILTNLIVNAHRHGRPPVTVTVASDGRTVTVRDHGPGYPDTLLTRGPQRFRTGARARGTGHGLGLTIALGQAHVIGATLEFGNAPGGGAVAVLQLPISGPEAAPGTDQEHGPIHD